jgi:hypothetical protein
MHKIASGVLMRASTEFFSMTWNELIFTERQSVGLLAE